MFDPTNHREQHVVVQLLHQQPFALDPVGHLPRQRAQQLLRRDRRPARRRVRAFQLRRHRRSASSVSARIARRGWSAGTGCSGDGCGRAGHRGRRSRDPRSRSWRPDSTAARASRRRGSHPPSSAAPPTCCCRCRSSPRRCGMGSLAEARDVSARQSPTAATVGGSDTLAENRSMRTRTRASPPNELMGASGMNPEEVRRALHDLERLGIAGNDTAATAFVHRGVPRASTSRLEEAIGLECALIDQSAEGRPRPGAGRRVDVPPAGGNAASQGRRPHLRCAGTDLARVAGHWPRMAAANGTTEPAAGVCAGSTPRRCG